MKVELLWPGPRRRWHALLADRLATHGHALVLSRGREGAPVPAGTGMLLAVERRIYKAGAPLFEVAAVPTPLDKGKRSIVLARSPRARRRISSSSFCSTAHAATAGSSRLS